jgi:ABC-2 type transport system permease protein
MLRYLRLYLHFLRFSFSRALEFRLDFFFRIVMDCVFYAVHLAFFGIVYQHTEWLGSWSLDQILIFASAYFLVDALHMTVFANNMWMFPFLINKGDLDYYLVRPVSSLFLLSLRDFAANSFLNVIIAASILAWALGRYPESLEPTTVITFVLLLVCGTFLYWIIYMFFMIPVFWFHSADGLRQLFFGMERFSERPDQIFRGWLRRSLLTILPFGLVASYPTHILFEGVQWQRLLHIVGVTAAAFLVMLWFWSRGLRSYSSASS